MATQKTQPTLHAVEKFLNTIASEQKRNDCMTLINYMQRISKSPPVMWGTNMIGFGNYHYQYESGREGDWFITGFSPRKSNISIYIMDGFESHQELLKKLGKHKTGASCLYINALADIDVTVLSELITKSVHAMKKRYPTS